MKERKRKITISYDDGINKKEINLESLYVDGLKHEDVAAAARLLIVMMSYPPEVAQDLVFVDKEDRERLGVEDGAFYGEL